jgi:hypothetical protein
MPYLSCLSFTAVALQEGCLGAQSASYVASLYGFVICYLLTKQRGLLLNTDKSLRHDVPLLAPGSIP